MIKLMTKKLPKKKFFTLQNQLFKNRINSNHQIYKNFNKKKKLYTIINS